jgi:hypothetical protein
LPRTGTQGPCRTYCCTLITMCTTVMAARLVRRCVVPFCFVSLRRSRAAGIMALERKIMGHRTGPRIMCRAAVSSPMDSEVFFFVVSLFHFTLLRCVRVFSEETGKTRRKEGGVSGEGQLNGGGLVISMPSSNRRSDNENRISIFLFRVVNM